MTKLSKAEAARTLGLSRTTLHKYIREGRITPDPDGKIDTTELLRRGFSLQMVHSPDAQPPVHPEQFWTGVHSRAPAVQLPDQLHKTLQEELDAARERERRLLSIIEAQQRQLEAQQRLLEAAKPPPLWPRLKAWVHGRRKAQEGAFS